MKQYLELLQNVLDKGHEKGDRTGTGTTSIFGAQMRFNLQEGFPLVTTKKVHMRSIIHELLWFLKGDTNVKYLQDNGVKIWDAWALPRDEVVVEEMSRPDRASWAIREGYSHNDPEGFYKYLNGLGLESADRYLDELGVPRSRERVVRNEGELGPIYSKQWRDWVGPDGQHHDQISNVIEQLINDPDSRRIIVSAWNVGELDQMALMPCHSFFQFYTRELSIDERLSWVKKNHPETNKQMFVERPPEVREQGTELEYYSAKLEEYKAPKRTLSCQLYMRSSDTFLGLPFNIASYALLTHMIAQQVNMVPGEFVWTGGDVHIYSNHMEQVKEQLTREPKPLPQLVIKRKPESIFDYQYNDFEIAGYDSHPLIKAPVAV